MWDSAKLGRRHRRGAAKIAGRPRHRRTGDPCRPVWDEELARRSTTSRAQLEEPTTGCADSAARLHALTRTPVRYPQSQTGNVRCVRYLTTN